jgi:hypothetical protein
MADALADAAAIVAQIEVIAVADDVATVPALIQLLV